MCLLNLTGAAVMAWAPTGCGTTRRRPRRRLTPTPPPGEGRYEAQPPLSPDLPTPACPHPGLAVVARAVQQPAAGLAALGGSL